IWYYRITLIILLFAVLLAWALLPGVHEFINRSVPAFAAVDQQGIERFIQSYGALAAVVSFLLMILQAIAAPLPAFLITFANASLFGAFWAAYCRGPVRWPAVPHQHFLVLGQGADAHR
ncbi:hypothetical protein, partial [Pseudomonas aeruginosa]|uniref:hypothetical protein n=1 Tax=Pseudomonas aeruginosa TaxID=287 RepID=UPI0031B75E3D